MNYSQITKHDLKYERSKIEKINIHIVQMGDFLPEKNLFDYIKSQDLIDEMKIKIMGKLNSICLSNDDSDLVIFPELVIPNEMIDSLIEFANNKKCYIIGGMLYDDKYYNKCAIIDSKGNKEFQYKCQIAPGEPDEVKTAHSQYDYSTHIFFNTSIGDFAVLICYDFSHTEILNDLRNKIDYLIVVSMNPSANDYLTDAEGIASSYYMHVFICNIAKNGYSGICSPVHGQRIIRKLNSGEEILECGFNLKEFIEAASNPSEYHKKVKPKRIYEYPPAGYARNLSWQNDNNQNTQRDCMRLAYPKLIENRRKIPNICREIEKYIDKDIDELSKCMEKPSDKDNRTLMRLNYLLEGLLDEVKLLATAKKYAMTRGPFVTEPLFASDFKYEFLPRIDFEKEYELKLESLKQQLENVAQACTKSCIGYGNDTIYCNVVSLKIPDDISEDIFLITRSTEDKSKIKYSDIVIVSPEWGYDKNRKEKLIFKYTNYNDEEIIRPSGETYLNYKIHSEHPHIKAILHFHHNNILNLAWKIPLSFINQNNSYVIHDRNGMPIPSIEGRDINIKEFSNKVVKKLRHGRSQTIIGTRHGAWTFGKTLEDCLKQARETNDIIGEYQRDDDDDDFNKIASRNDKLFKCIVEYWNNPDVLITVDEISKIRPTSREC